MQGPTTKTFRSLMLSAPVEADRQPVGWGGVSRECGSQPQCEEPCCLAEAVCLQSPRV